MLGKISLFCNIKKEDVIQNLTADSLYEVPIMLENQGLAERVCKHLNIADPEPDLSDWTDMIEHHKTAKKSVTIGLVGKYVALPDAYLSVAEALRHGGIYNSANVNIKWINSEEISNLTIKGLFADVDGIIVPGGFGGRGVEGMIETVRYARENKIPFFGICLGMQVAVIEFARNVLGYADANTTEIDPDTVHNVIDIMDEQKDVTNKGGTMRLGLYPCKLKPGSLAEDAYGDSLIYERHRHRWEFNNAFRKELAEAGLQITGISPDEKLVEIIENAEHPWFVGVQFHPEFKSRPNKPQKLFHSFIKAVCENNS
jgi:CTP synthase